MSGTNVREQRAHGKAFLKSNGIESHTLDAGLLLMEAAGLTKAALYTNGDQPLSDRQVEQYERLLHARASHKPMQYILKRCEFMSLDFYVDENVLIPRPDTELLAEHAIALSRGGRFANVLELGTGSGCLAVSIAHYCADVRVTAVDVCEKALAVAGANVRAHEVSDRVDLIRGDLFENVEKPAGGFGLIVSNPPYIPSGALNSLPDCVRLYEPQKALSGGEDGLRFYREIAERCGPFISPGGFLLFEIGREQARAVSGILRENGFHDISVLQDLAGLDRVVAGHT